MVWLNHNGYRIMKQKYSSVNRYEKVPAHHNTHRFLHTFLIMLSKAEFMKCSYKEDYWETSFIKQKKCSGWWDQMTEL